MIFESILIDSPNTRASQTNNTITRINQSHRQRSGLPHLFKNPFRCYLIILATITIQPIAIFHQDLLMLWHIDHKSKINEQGNDLPAMNRPDSHPVTVRATISPIRVSPEQLKTSRPIRPNRLKLFPIWAFRYNLEFRCFQIIQ